LKNMKSEQIIGAIVLVVGIALVAAGAYSELTPTEFGFSIGGTLVLVIGVLMAMTGAALALSRK
jgi:hypothetical protein